MSKTPRKPSRFDTDAPTLATIRTNLRNLRRMQGLTQEGLINRLGDDSSINLLALSRIEQGERDISAVELMQLAVALLVTPNDLMFPWPGSSDPVKKPPISGADYEYCKIEDVQAWWRHGKYPKMEPDQAIARKGASIEGQALADIMRDDMAASHLAMDSSPNNYQYVIMQFIWARYDRLYKELDQLQTSAFDWLPDLDRHANYRISLPYPGALRNITSPEWNRLTDETPWTPSDQQMFTETLYRVKSGILCLDRMRDVDMKDQDWARFNPDPLNIWITDNRDTLAHMDQVLTTLAIMGGVEVRPYFEDQQVGTTITWPKTFNAEPVTIIPDIAMLETEDNTSERIKNSPLVEPPALSLD